MIRWPVRFLLTLLFSISSAADAQQVKSASGHHYSFLEGARIGHDFGRNPFATRSNDAASLGFDTSFGRSRLRSAMASAVAAGETRMSFDLAFDFRSLVLFDAGVAVALDEWALRNVAAFLRELDAADRLARLKGRAFAADVVLVDHAVADGVAQEGPFEVGEHPELIIDTFARQKLLDVLGPVFSKLVSHPKVTINLMNEPEFVSLSALDAARMFHRGGFRDVTLTVTNQSAAQKSTVSGSEVGRFLLEADPRSRFQVRRPGTDIVLAQTGITSSDLTEFLVDLWRSVIASTELRADFDDSGRVDFADFLVFAGCFGSDVSSPDWRVDCDLEADSKIDFADFVLFADDFGRVRRRPEITIGWADDVGALANTPLLEALAGDVVTDVISFHVYEVPQNRFHPLTTARSHFATAGYGGRVIRITEWGLGGVSGDGIATAIAGALNRAEGAGFSGVIFWWDNDHVFDNASFERACE